MALKGVQIVTEEPELGVLGALAYRGYQIGQGINDLAQAALNRQNEDKNSQEARIRASEIVASQTASSSTYISYGPHMGLNQGGEPLATSSNSYSSGGTYIFHPPPSSRPSSQNSSDQGSRRSSISSNGEDFPMLTENQPEAWIDIPLNQEQEHLIDTHSEMGGIRNRRGSRASEASDVSMESEPGVVQQPAPTANRSMSRVIAGASGVVGAVAVGAGTYIQNLNRPVNVRVPSSTGDPLLTPNPSNPPASIPTTNPPTSIPITNPVVPLPPENFPETPTPIASPTTPEPPPEKLKTPESIPSTPSTNPPPTSASANNPSEPTERIILKEVPGESNVIPSLLFGIAMGAIITRNF